MKSGTPPKILLTGATGLLGPWLAPVLSSIGSLTTSSLHGGNIPCDLRNPASAAELISRTRPDIIVHTPALTDVDRCEREPTLADQVNHLTVEHLINELAPEARLLFISTDQVYSGNGAPHDESATCPANVYGATKLAGETAAQRHPQHLILRTNFFGPSKTPDRSSFSDFITKTIQDNSPLHLYENLAFNPVHLSTLAAALLGLLKLNALGIYNVGSRQGLSKYQFGLEVAKHLHLPTTKIVPCISQSSVERAPRPLDLRTNVNKLEQALNQVMPTLHEEVAKL